MSSSSSCLTHQECCLIVEKKIGSNNYEFLDYTINPITVNGFFGEHSKLEINIIFNNEEKTLKFFVKSPPKGATQLSIVTDGGTFIKEAFFYREFVPMLQKFGISEIESCIAQCFFVGTNNIMVFDDLSVEGFQPLNNDPLSYETIQIIVKKLAILHASSIILEEKLAVQTKSNYSLIHQFEKELDESFFTRKENHKPTMSWNLSISAINDEVALFPELKEEMQTATFKEKIKNAFELFRHLVIPSTQYRNVICHGDLWNSNILIKKDNNLVDDCRLVDFQIIRYCPPAHDLLGLIYLTTNRQFRNEYLTTLIQEYYKEFTNILEKYGCKTEEIYPYHTYLESIDYMLPQSVCQTALYYHTCIANPNLIGKYMETEDTIQRLFLCDIKSFIIDMCDQDSTYKTRLKETLEDLKELCYKYF